MKKIAVTGSNGFIGKALCQTLRNDGIEVISIDSLPAIGDEPVITADIIASVSGVIHLGAMARALWGESYPAECFSLNSAAVAQVLGLVRTFNPGCWLLLASSKEVYGDPSIIPVTEDHPLRPKGVYARSKVEAERLVLLAGESGVTCGIARLSTVYGDVGDHPGRLIPSCVKAAISRSALSVDSSTAVFDPTHIRDVVRGLYRFAEVLEKKLRSDCLILNLCGGQGATIYEIVDAISAGADSPIETRRGKPRLFMSKQFVGSNAKAKKILGWAPDIEYREGLLAYATLVRRAQDLESMFQEEIFLDRLLKTTLPRMQSIEAAP